MNPTREWIECKNFAVSMMDLRFDMKGEFVSFRWGVTKNGEMYAEDVTHSPLGLMQPAG